MKIFISHIQSDKNKVNEITLKLKESGHEILTHNKAIRIGDNWIKEIDSLINDVDAVIIVISKKALNRVKTFKEIEAIVLNVISNTKLEIIPVIVDNVIPPSYLLNYKYVDLTQGVSKGLKEIQEILSNENDTTQVNNTSSNTENSKKNLEFINHLKKSYKEGNLTLVCGAGVSIGANIPSWHNLLLDLFEKMIARISDDENISLKSDDTFKAISNASTLIVGKYLKSNLGKDFYNELRDSLYKNNPTTCDLIEAIVGLAKIGNQKKILNSIVTFNFDGLIEENLDKHKIKYKTIESEDIRYSSDELPVYHVHGYLPRKGSIDPNKNIVFSEDTYHTQFIEPFSWSNMMQLQKLRQTTCLLIGISLADPNMRRLLDVSNRKKMSKKRNPSVNINHYIIKKIPHLEGKTQKEDELMKFLEEQDANELGMNVIWVNDFNEISTLLKKLVID